VINGASFVAAGLKTTPLSVIHAAVRWGGIVLALATCMMATPLGLLLVAALLSLALHWTGMHPGRQVAALRPWLPIALLVMVVHVFTTTWAAPLGHPSLAGALAGGKALLRVVCSVGCLGLYLRVTPLDDLVVGVSWWLRPLRPLGVRTEDLGLMLAVAMGTAPTVLGEGRRIEAVVTMRQSAPAGTVQASGGNPVSRFFRTSVDRARILVPLLETLTRRAEALTLSLRHRRPQPDSSDPVPAVQMAVLILWTVGLVWWAVSRTGEAMG
jgi:energy-coupling factor transporter transmembrane protein EcfT